MSVRSFGAATLHLGDCTAVLPTLRPDSVDSVVTDPPAGIGFMGRAWDGDRGGRDSWCAWMRGIAAQCLRVAKPGAHALVWALPRTSHWTASAWEDAGWEIRDRVSHVFGTGFPKNHDVSKALDRTVGAERETAPTTDEAKQWEGWGTALKPACEDWWMLRKPLSEPTVAANVLRWSCGALNINGCRIELNGDYKCGANGRPSLTGLGDKYDPTQANKPDTVGRWPAHLTHDGSDEVEDAFAAFGPEKSNKAGVFTTDQNVGWAGGKTNIGSSDGRARRAVFGYGDSGTASRFFYCAKSSRADRGEGNIHPTVKSTALMRWLVRLVTPPGGSVLDPFMGSGSTGRAALLEGFGFVGIEQSADYVEIACRRVGAALMENHA